MTSPGLDALREAARLEQAAVNAGRIREQLRQREREVYRWPSDLDPAVIRARRRVLLGKEEP